jgi:hypothetical protein
MDKAKIRQELLSKFKASGHELLRSKSVFKFGTLTHGVPLMSDDESNLDPIGEMPADTQLIIAVEEDGNVQISQDGQNFIEVEIEDGDIEEDEDIPEDSLEEEEFRQPTPMGPPPSASMTASKDKPEGEPVQSAGDPTKATPPGEGSNWGIDDKGSKRAADGVPVSETQGDELEKAKDKVTPSEIEGEGTEPAQEDEGNTSFGKTKEIGQDIPGIDKLIMVGDDNDAAIMEIKKLSEDGKTSANVITFSSMNGNTTVRHGANLYSVVASAKDLTAAGVNVYEEGGFLLRGSAWKRVKGLLCNWKLEGSSTKMPIKQTYVFPKENRAFIVRTSDFVTSMVTASLVPGTKGSKYTTFIKMGKSYVSQDGFLFSAEKLKAMGYPKFVVVAQSNKSYFEKSGVKAGDYVQSMISTLDREYFSQVVQSYNDKIQRQEGIISSLRGSMDRMAKSQTAILQKVQKEKNALASKVLNLQKDVTEQKRINASITRKAVQENVAVINQSAMEQGIEDRAALLMDIMGNRY